jgi:hypothetical protein
LVLVERERLLHLFSLGHRSFFVLNLTHSVLLLQFCEDLTADS